MGVSNEERIGHVKSHKLCVCHATWRVDCILQLPLYDMKWSPKMMCASWS